MKKLIIFATVLLAPALASAQFQYVRYLGSSTTDPVGTCTRSYTYYNTTAQEMRVCSGVGPTWGALGGTPAEITAITNVAYVSKSGSDTAGPDRGTEAMPWLTLAGAKTQLWPVGGLPVSDVDSLIQRRIVFLDSGTWAESITLPFGIIALEGYGVNISGTVTWNHDLTLGLDRDGGSLSILGRGTGVRASDSYDVDTGIVVGTLSLIAENSSVDTSINLRSANVTSFITSDETSPTTIVSRGSRVTSLALADNSTVYSSFDFFDNVTTATFFNIHAVGSWFNDSFIVASGQSSFTDCHFVTAVESISAAGGSTLTFDDGSYARFVAAGWTATGSPTNVVDTAAIGGRVTGATAGSLPFVDSSGKLAQDNSNLFWTAATARLSIGTNSANGRLEVVDSRGADDHPVRFTNNGDANFMQIVSALAPNLSNGRHVSGFFTGTAFSNKNGGYMSFFRVGDASTTNRLSFGFHSVDDVFNVFANNHASLGTAAPNTASTFEVADTVHPTIHLGTGTASQDTVFQMATASATDDGAIYIDEGDARKLKFSLGNVTWNKTNRDNNAKLTIQQDGKVGVGTTGPANVFDVEGAVAVGATYSGTSAAPSNGMIVEGSVGVGTTGPASKLDVEGGISVGATYSGTTAAPTNGMIVEGSVGVGTNAPNVALDVVADIATRATSPGAFTGTQNDFAIGAFSFARLSGSSTPIITGIAANNQNGKVLTIRNIGGTAIQFNNEDGGSSGANQIITGTGAARSLAAGATVSLTYDSVSTRWCMHE